MKRIIIIFLIPSLIGCFHSKEEQVLPYLIDNNKLIESNINLTIKELSNCSSNKYYMDYVGLYVEKINKIIKLIEENDLQQANSLIQEIKSKEEFPSYALKHLSLINNSSSIDKTLSINRLLSIENRLVYDMYNMKVKSNFELDAVKLFAIGNNTNNNVKTYEAKLVLIGINSKNKYSVIIDNDTLKDYGEQYFPIYKASVNKSKKMGKKKAILLIDRWGSKGQLSFDIDLDLLKLNNQMQLLDN